MSATNTHPLPAVPAVLSEDEQLALGAHLAAALDAAPPRVVLDTGYAAGLVWDAARWRALAPALIDAAETASIRLARESSWAISAAADWRGLAHQPTHAELRRRRADHATPARTPDEIRQHTAASWAALDTDNKADTGRGVAA